MAIHATITIQMIRKDNFRVPLLLLVYNEAVDLNYV
jgi:hypothetical protein